MIKILAIYLPTIPKRTKKGFSKKHATKSHVDWCCPLQSLDRLAAAKQAYKIITFAALFPFWSILCWQCLISICSCQNTPVKNQFEEMNEVFCKKPHLLAIIFMYQCGSATNNVLLQVSSIKYPNQFPCEPRNHTTNYQYIRKDLLNQASSARYHLIYGHFYKYCTFPSRFMCVRRESFSTFN